MKISVLGAGSWGTALSCLIAQKHKVMLLARNQQTVEEINTHKTNKKYCGNHVMANNITATKEIDKIQNSDIIFFTVPAQAIRHTAEQIKKLQIKQTAYLVSCAKGIEKTTLDMPYKIIQSLLPNNNVAVLSGPNFAKEIIEGKIAAADIASENINCAKNIAKILQSNKFSAIATNDPTSVQVSGIMKNIIAIGCGMIMGWEMGENARALAFYHGLREISLLYKAMSGKEINLCRLSSAGDLFLTCASLTSRNTMLGFNIAQQKLHNHCPLLSEGKASADSLTLLTNKFNLKLPFSELIAKFVMQITKPDKELCFSILLNNKI